jgi:hypothetical protein
LLIRTQTTVKFGPKATVAFGEELAPMAQEDLDALLARMDAMAKAANAFTSEALQKEAFAAMIAAFEGKRHSVQHRSTPHLPPEPQSTEPPDADPIQMQTLAGSGNKAKVKSSTKDSRTAWKMVKDLNLRPEGKQSFEAFVEEKKPSSNQDKYAVVVYYLKEILEMPAVTVHQVGTVFRVMKSWKESTDVAGALRVASHRKGTLDTNDIEDIKLTPTGRNLVEHDLPPKTKGKK